MQSDSLNQVGKSIKQGKKDARSALDRYSENFPKIERVRDIVSQDYTATEGDAANDFIMYFKTKQDDNRVLLDLMFFRPWCGCFQTPQEV